MRIYAQLSEGGVVIAITSAAGPIESPNMLELQSFDESALGKLYDPAASEAAGQAVFVAAPAAEPPAATRRLAPLAFRRRFTRPERIAIEWAALDRAELPAARRMQAAELRADLKDQDQAQYIDLDDADTVQGVHGLEAVGLIAAGRAAEILGAPVLPEERP